jgi:hypothetical protein
LLASHQVWVESAGRLRELGFRRACADTFAADGVTLKARGGWLTLSADGGPRELWRGSGMLGRPGLWKPAAGDNGDQAFAFDLPLASLIDRLGEGDDGDVDTPDAVGALVRWALRTRPGAAMPRWQPPPADHVSSFVGAADLSLRCGPYIQQIAVALHEGRLSLGAPICRLGEQMAGPRRRWLDRLLADCEGIRMVRVGVRESGAAEPALEAEIDLSGVPSEVLESLLSIAVDALRACFSLLAATAAVICDPQCQSLALDGEPGELLKPFNTRSFKKRSHTP